MPNSVSGLATGLNTSDIINAMLRSEQASKTRLQARQGVYNRQLSIWQDISTKLGSLKTAAEGLSSPTKMASATATSSDETLVVATASSSAAPTNLTFRVKQLATSHQKMATGFVATTDLVGAGKAHVATGLDPLGLTVSDTTGIAAGRYELEVKSIDAGAGTATFVFAGKEQTVSTAGPITLTDNGTNSIIFTVGTLTTGKATLGVVTTTASTTLAGLATAINQLGAGVSAAAVDTKDGSPTPTAFVLSARDPGTAHELSSDFSGLSGMASATFNNLRAATDAELLLANGTTIITRSSNRITDVVPGVTLDLRAADPSQDVTVTVGQDHDSMIDATMSAIDSLNSVINAIKKGNVVEPGARAGTSLSGDTRLRGVSAALVTAMRYTDTGQDKQVLTQIGITLQRNGTYAVDEAKLRTALAEDHTGTVRLLSGDGGSRLGVLGTLAAAIKPMLESNGAVAGAIEATRTSITAMNTRIERENQRLALFENRVRRQYTNLERTMSQLQSQANGLSNSLR